MSELKAIRSGEIYNIIEYEDCYRTDDLYYPKSEADAVLAEKDKVIAEKDQKIDLYKRGWEESDRINASIYAELRHHKYKRCLAMAKWCDTKADWYYSIGESFRDRVEFYIKWHKRWLKIAEKFKEAHDEK